VFITGTTLSSAGLQAAKQAHTASAASKRGCRIEYTRRLKTASAFDNARHPVTTIGKGVEKLCRFKASGNNMIRTMASGFPDGDFASGRVLRFAL
jgi:hypothetical protein